MGITAPEYNPDLFAKVEYEELVIRAMTLQPIVGKTTIVEGYTIEEGAKLDYNTSATVGDARRSTGLETTGFNIPRSAVQDKVAAAHRVQEDESRRKEEMKKLEKLEADRREKEILNKADEENKNYKSATNTTPVTNIAQAMQQVTQEEIGSKEKLNEEIDMVCEADLAKE